MMNRIVKRRITTGLANQMWSETCGELTEKSHRYDSRNVVWWLGCVGWKRTILDTCRNRIGPKHGFSQQLERDRIWVCFGTNTSNSCLGHQSLPFKPTCNPTNYDQCSTKVAIKQCIHSGHVVPWLKRINRSGIGFKWSHAFTTSVANNVIMIAAMMK